MIKADRYTADGCAEINKALENETEDVRYNIGDISQKTGLQKTANGWVKPKKSGKITPKGKDLMERAANNPKLSERGRAAASKLAKEYGEKLSGSNSENWKTDVVSKMETSKLEKMDKDFEEFKKSGQEVSPAAKERNDIVKAELAKRSENKPTQTKTAKFDEYGLPSNETIEMKNKFLEEENVSDPSKLSNAEFNALAEKLDKKLGINNKERAQELLVAEVEEDETSEEDITSGYSLTREEHDMDTLKANAKNIPALQPLVRQREPFFQKKFEAYKKLKENPSNPKARADFVDATNAINQIDADIDRVYKEATAEEENSAYWIQDPQGNRLTNEDAKERIKANFKEIERLKTSGEPRAEMKIRDLTNYNNHLSERLKPEDRTTDAAPRCLTGDCKIRVRKSR